MSGRMVRCAAEPCERRARVVGRRSTPWTCEPCERGEAPYRQPRKAAGVKAKTK